jgi:hypothetical protein
MVGFGSDMASWRLGGETMKIYSDDPLVHYKNSTVPPERTKSEIDGILAEYGTVDVWWHWDPAHNDIYVNFRVEEIVDEILIRVSVKLPCPTVWDRARPRARPPAPEQINWRVSMRALHWFIKTNLEMTRIRQSDKITAFLPFIASADGKTSLRDYIIPKLGKQGIPELDILPEPKEQKYRVLEAEYQEKKE